MQINAIKQLVAALAEEKDKVRLMGLSGDVSALADAVAEYERPLLVAVMGEFKTGKSTFLNVILGADLLRTNELTATAVVTVLRYGTTPRMVLHFLGGTSRPESIDKIREFTSVGDESMKALLQSIEFVEVFYPCEHLRNVNFVDTPGLNDPVKSHVHATERFKSYIDAVLWVFDAEHSGSRTEVDQLRQLSAHLAPLGIVNKIDRIDEEEEGNSVADVLEYTRKNLGDSIQAVVGVSAKLARHGDFNGAGWPAFQQAFHRMTDGKFVKKRAEFEQAVKVFKQAVQERLDSCEGMIAVSKKTTLVTQQETSRLHVRHDALQELMGRLRAIG